MATNAPRPKRPIAVDAPQDVRDRLSRLRDHLIMSRNFDDAVILTHALQWLNYLCDLEVYNTLRRGTFAPVDAMNPPKIEERESI